MARDYYDILDVGREASPEEIKRAYRKLVRELHPDINPDPAAQDRFKAVTAAYEVLSDPQKRQIVDLGGDPLAQAGGGGGAGPFAGFGGLGDIMDAFFGSSGAGARGPRSRMRQGADALIQVQLPLAEMAFGTTRDLTVDTAVVCTTCAGAGAAVGTSPVTCGTCQGRGEISQVQRSFLGQIMTTRVCPSCAGLGTVIPTPCPECGGDGRVRARRTTTVKIPAGVEHGMRIRLSGEGEVGSGGGPAGDLYVELLEQEHATFTRKGDDLHCQVTVPMTAAALGTTCTLQTLDGEEEINVPPGTQPGTIITLRARGVPHLRGVGRGDLNVHVEVRTPIRINEEQEALLREFAKLRGEEQPELRAEGGLFSRLRRGAFR